MCQERAKIASRRAMSDRAGARPYVRLRVRTNSGVEVPIGQNWLVLLKTGACCGLPIFFEVTTNWRAGCQKLACPVRREGRPESSSLPLSTYLRGRVLTLT